MKNKCIYFSRGFFDFVALDSFHKHTYFGKEHLLSFCLKKLSPKNIQRARRYDVKRTTRSPELVVSPHHFISKYQGSSMRSIVRQGESILQETLFPMKGSACPLQRFRSLEWRWAGPNHISSKLRMPRIFRSPIKLGSAFKNKNTKNLD